MRTILGAILEVLCAELSTGVTRRPRIVALVREKGFDDPRLDLNVAKMLLDLVERGIVARTLVSGRAYYHLSETYLDKLKKERDGCLVASPLN